MSPLGVGSSHTNTLKTGEAKLWILLVGVNQYQDTQLPSLRYPAIDCKALGEALAKATQGFPQKEVLIHHDFAPELPTSATVRNSLERMVTQTRSQDTILLYFSGHGILDPITQQPVLCMADTSKTSLIDTGIGMQELLHILGNSSAHQQLVCLDTCHSGDMMLRGTNPTPRDAETSPVYLNSTPQLLQVLRQRAAQSKGFCALLSCDQGQQSWEFPELGHGVFTYFLMRGLLGEAADSQGVIEADGLYKYVYRQTLQYINKLNQQVRLINQQKRNRGDSKIHPEYPLQTPKRIVEGVGELILGFKPEVEAQHQEKVTVTTSPQRHAILVDGITNGSKTLFDFGRVLQRYGDFQIEYFPSEGKNCSQVRAALQTCLRREILKPNNSSKNNIPTTLLYLRGSIEEIEDGEAWLVFDGVRLSRSWLRQELRRAATTQKIIIILDCPGATTLANWLEDLHLTCEQPQCIIASQSTQTEPDLFFQTLLGTLAESDPQIGLSIAAWVAHLQSPLESKHAQLHVWLSGIQSIIDILPGNITSICEDEEQFSTSILEANTGIVNIKPILTVQSPEQENVPIAEKSSLQSDFPILESLDSTAVESFVIVGSQQHSQLQQLLTRLIGPIAPTLLRKVLVKAKNPKQLLEELAIHLPTDQQIEFEVQVMRIVQTLTDQTQTNLPNSTNPPNPQFQPIDATLLGQCQRELTDLIGPIASYIIHDIFKAYPQITPTEFINKLASEIPDARLAMEFQQRFEGKGVGSRE
jgi:uncharacterized caspase-like protein